MRALDRIKLAISMKPTRKAITLPDESEFEFYSRPITLAQRAKARKQAATDDTTDFALQLLVMLAEDENGQRLFSAGELAELRNELPASVVEAILIQLSSDGEPEEEPLDPKSLKTNSRTTTS